MTFRLLTLITIGIFLASCGPKTTQIVERPEPTGTCSGVYPSYWQDPKFPDMYEGQKVSNQAKAGYSGRIFQLSDAFPKTFEDESADQPWRSSKFDAMFDPATGTPIRTALAEEYSWLVMQYIQAGNINSGNVDTDWDVCNNPIRSWNHIPYQTYNVLAGREFTHGLTREAPVKFSMDTSPKALKGTMWAVGFFNPTAAYTLGTVWQDDGTPIIPTSNLSFKEGAVIGKPLFTTLTPSDMPFLTNLPAWKANISDPDFCGCTAKDENGDKRSCTMAEESQQCPRTLTKWGDVTLLQFDIAVKDSRANGTEWVFGTFVADGLNKANETNPWNRISPLGLMWGNSTPPFGQLASAYPENPRENGFEDMAIFWDAVDILNENGGSDIRNHPGHLGCNSRLDGPADKAYSSCMSCHGTASVADDNIKVPPIAAQFGGLTSECALPDPNSPNKWIDASGAPASQKSIGKDGPVITFDELDSLYFASTDAAVPFNTTVMQGTNAVNVLPGQPAYNGSVAENWISLDYSLQLSISLVQYKQWQAHEVSPVPQSEEVHEAILPRR